MPFLWGGPLCLSYLGDPYVRVYVSRGFWHYDTVTFVSNFLICSKAYSSLVPHFLDLPMHVRSLERFDIVEIPRRADPGKLLTLDWFWGFGASTVASTFLLEICNPSPVSTSPMYSKLSPCFSNLRITLSRFSSCLLWSRPLVGTWLFQWLLVPLIVSTLLSLSVSC